MIKNIIICMMLITAMIFAGCSKDVSKDTVNASNSAASKEEIVEQLRTDHFVFYSKKQDKDCIKDLSKALEDNFAKVTKDLNIKLTKSISIYIYSDLDTFHKVINRPDAPNWVVGTVTNLHTIKMVNPSNADGRPYESFMKVIVHEFVHIAVANMNSDNREVPIWLNDGIATFEAGQSEGVGEIIAKAKASNAFPALKDLDDATYDFGSKGGYQFSYSIVEYIVSNYGYDKLVALIKSPSDFEKILGISVEDFQKQWVSSLK